jgi:CheY-like chemotaxis protein
MPEMDGFEFLEALRRREGTASVPVVVITAKDLTPEDLRRLNGGVERIVQRSGLDRETLSDAVRALVAAHATGHERTAGRR